MGPQLPQLQCKFKVPIRKVQMKLTKQSHWNFRQEIPYEDWQLQSFGALKYTKVQAQNFPDEFFSMTFDEQTIRWC